MSKMSCPDCEYLKAEFAKNPAQNEYDEKRKKLVKPVAIAAIFGGVALSLTAVSVPFVLPAFRRICLPYVPATDNQIANVFKALKQNSANNRASTGFAKKLVDIGSGDGRIVIEAASRHGYTSVGIELNSILVLISRWRAWRAGLTRDEAVFKRQNLWRIDLSEYGTVVIFGVEQMMEKLQEKLVNECQREGESSDVKAPDSYDVKRVVACRYPFPDSWKPVATVGSGVDQVWLYHL